MRLTEGNVDRFEDKRPDWLKQGQPPPSVLDKEGKAMTQKCPGRPEDDKGGQCEGCPHKGQYPCS